MRGGRDGICRAVDLPGKLKIWQLLASAFLRWRGGVRRKALNNKHQPSSKPQPSLKAAIIF